MLELQVFLLYLAFLMGSVEIKIEINEKIKIAIAIINDGFMLTRKL